MIGFYSYKHLKLKIFLAFISALLLTYSAAADSLDLKNQFEPQLDRVIANQLKDIDLLIKENQLTQALNGVDEILETNPEIPKIHLVKAEIILRRSNFRDALDYLTSKVDQNPEDMGFRAARAQFLLSNGYLESARLEFYKAYEKGFRPVDILKILADIESEKGNLKESIKLISQALELTPEEAGLWHKKAQLELKLARVVDAKQSILKAVHFDFNNLEYHKMYAEILLYLKQHAEFQSYIVKIHEAFPDSAWISLRVSSLYVQQKNLNGAIDVLVKALDKNPQNHLIRFQLATILAGQRKWDESLKFFKEGLKLDPDSTWAMVQMAKVYLQSNRLNEAIKYLKSAKDKKSQDPFVYETLARIYNRKNDTFEAERIILEGLSINDKNQTLILEYANLLEKRGNVKETTKAYEEALKNEGENSFVLGKLGNLYRIAENYEASQKTLEKALKLSPKSTWIRAYYIETLADLKQWERALEEIEKLLSIMPDDYWAYAKRAMILMRRDQLEEAQASISKSIGLRPNANWLREIEGRILEKRKKYADSEKAFIQATNQSPENTYLLTRLAYVQLHLDEERALKTVRKSLNTDDFDLDTIELYFYLSGKSTSVWGFTMDSPEYKIYQKILSKEFDEAEDMLDEMSAKKHGNAPYLRFLWNYLKRENGSDFQLTSENQSSASQPWQFFYKGINSSRNRDYESAKGYFQKAYELSPENPWIIVKLAYSHQQLKEHKEAVELLNDFFHIQTDNEYLWLQLRLALNYDLAKMYSDSERVYLLILDRKPNDNIALNNLAWMYLNAKNTQLHKLDEALKLALRAVELQPSPANLDTLAEAYYQKKDYNRALKAIEQALDKDRRGLDDFKKTKKKIIRAMESEENQ